jgi:hypothetical protein
MTTTEFEKYKRLMQFAKTKATPQGLSNLYLLQTIDPDGNVVDEAYGMNMMTNHGFFQYFQQEVSWPHYVYLGDYTGTRESSALIGGTIDGKLYQRIGNFHDEDSLRNTTIDYDYPMYYYEYEGSNPAAGIVTCVCKFQESTFKANIETLNETKDITEYGIGSSYDQLWTHSWVYNIQGELSAIKKETGNILTMSIYMCMSYETSLITTGLTNGQHIIITTLKQFLENNRMIPDTCGTYCRYNSWTSRGKNTPQKSLIVDNTQTVTINVPSFQLLKDTTDANGYIDGWTAYREGFGIIEPQTLNVGQEEEFELDVSLPIPLVLDDGLKTYFSTFFGKKNDENAIPITQLTMDNTKGDGIWLYDATHSNSQNPYTITLPYTNNANHWYTETSFWSGLAHPISLTNNLGNIVKYYVYVNTHPEDPIIKFDNPSGITTIYGTDAYWNRIGGTWTQVTNPSNVPQAAQTCHYYITNTNQLSLNPIRQSLPLTLTPTYGQYETYNFQLNMNRDTGGAYATCSNCDTAVDSNHTFFVRNTSIYIPSAGTWYTINNQNTPISSDTAVYGSSCCIHHVAYANKLLTSIYNDTNIYLTDISNTNQITCTVINMAAIFNDNSQALLSSCYKTESMTGLVCYQRTNENASVVIDLTRGTQYTTTSFSSKMACAIYDTRSGNHQRIAYMATDNMIHVYDFNTSTDALILNPPMPDETTATDCYCMWGFQDHLYMTGNGWTWHWDLSSNNVDGNSCITNPTFITTKSDSQYIRFSVAKNIMIMYKYQHAYCDYSDASAEQDFQCIYYFNLDNFDPTSFGTLSDFRYPTTNADKRLQRDMNCLSLKLQYIENEKALALVYQFHQNIYTSSTKYGYMMHGVIDFGQYVNPPSGYQPIVKHNWTLSEKGYPTGSTAVELYNNGVFTWTVFGDHIIYGNQKVPIAALMPFHIKGRTRTISAINNIKSLQNKTFTITYANHAPNTWNPDDKNGYPPGDKN